MTAMSIHVVMAAASAHIILLSCCIGRSVMITDTIPVFINKANTAVGSMVVTDAITVIVNKVRTFLRGAMIADTIPVFVNKTNTAVGSMVVTDSVTICVHKIDAVASFHAGRRCGNRRNAAKGYESSGSHNSKNHFFHKEYLQCCL